MSTNGSTEARKLRSRLDHPIIDADGHWTEYLPVMREEFRRTSEVVLQDPVYLEDAVRIALGGVVADFLRGQTSSTYTPLYRTIDSLIRPPKPEKKQD